MVETVLGFIFGVNVLARDNLLQQIADITLSDTGHTMILDPNLELFVTDSEAGLSLKPYVGNHKFGVYCTGHQRQPFRDLH